MMELKIFNPTDDGFVKNIEWNHEEIKAEVAEKMKEYASVVYSENQIKEAKADRAKLNKFVQALEVKRKEIKKQCMQPYDDFEKKMKEITALVNESITAIDTQVKEYEEQKKAEKLKKLQEYFFALPVIEGFEELELGQFFDTKWLNATVSLKKAEEEISKKVEEIQNNFKMLFDLPEFGFEAMTVYKSTLDVTKAVNEAQRMASVQKAKAEHEKAIAQSQEDNATARAEEIAGQTSFNSTQAFDDYVDEFRTPEKEWIKFQAYMTVDEAIALKNFFKARNIEFKAVD